MFIKMHLVQNWRANTQEWLTQERNRNQNCTLSHPVCSYSFVTYWWQHLCGSWRSIYYKEQQPDCSKIWLVFHIIWSYSLEINSYGMVFHGVQLWNKKNYSLCSLVGFCTKSRCLLHFFLSIVTQKMTTGVFLRRYKTIAFCTWT